MKEWSFNDGNMMLKQNGGWVRDPSPVKLKDFMVVLMYLFSL